MDEKTVFDWRYPCKECDKEDCHVACSRWRKWVYAIWGEVCRPFDKLKEERMKKC